MNMMAQVDGTRASKEEIAILTSLSIAARLIDDSAYSLATIKPGNESSSLFILAAALEKEMQRVAGTAEN